MRTLLRITVVSAVTGLTFAGMAVLPTGAQAAAATTRVTSFPWTVPAGVEIVRVLAGGGRGGNAVSPGGGGGAGGALTSTFSLPPGSQITVGLGENGGDGNAGSAGGASGLGQPSGGDGGRSLYAKGGGGGGATALAYKTSAMSDPSVFALLGGGGGGGAATTGGGPSYGGAGGGGGYRPDTSAAGGDGNSGYAYEFSFGGGRGGGSTSRAGESASPAGYSGGGGGGAGANGGLAGRTGDRWVPPDESAGGGGGGGSSVVDGGLFVATVRDIPLASGAYAAIDYVSFETAALSTGVAGTAYSQDVDAVFGTGSQVDAFTVAPTLPTGLSLNGATGVITGTPVAASSATYTFTATALNSDNAVVGRTTKSYTLTIGAASSPAITAVSPGTGPVAGGIFITITGTDLTGATSVSFAGVDVTPTSVSATSVQAVLPTGSGTVDVAVITPGGTALKSAAFTYSPPTIAFISPASGSANGGTSIYVDGNDLLYTQSITFGGVRGSLVTITNTRVTVLAPSSNTLGPVDVVLTRTDATTTRVADGFTYSASSPTPPTLVTAVAGVERATVSWTPGSNGGQSVIYTVSSGSFTCTSTTTSCDVTGLTGGVGYTFSVIATNATGSSASSSISNSVTPTAATVPAAPSLVTAVASSGQALVSWTPEANGGRLILDYTVTSSPGLLTCVTASTSCSVTGLTNGTAYTFTVKARNSVGSSSASAASSAVTPTASGGGSSGGAQPTPATTQPSTTPTPAPSASQSPTAIVPVQRKAAGVSAFTAPKTIKAPGTTILVRSALRTTDGVVVRARASIVKVTARNLGPAPKAKAGARVIYGPKGRVSVVNDGKQPIIVTLTLTAPGTATSLPLRDVHRWNVARAKR